MCKGTRIPLVKLSLQRVFIVNESVKVLYLYNFRFTWSSDNKLFDVSHCNSEIGQSSEFQLIMLKAIYMVILFLIMLQGNPLQERQYEKCHFLKFFSDLDL